MIYKRLQHSYKRRCVIYLRTVYTSQLTLLSPFTLYTDWLTITSFDLLSVPSPSLTAEHSGTFKALPPPEHDFDPYYRYAAPPQYHRRGGEGATSRRRRHGSSDRRNRKAIAAALAKLLLEPLSPSDSDDDGKPLLSAAG